MASALTARAGTGPVIPPARCSRTFITFSDDATFEEWFPQGRPPKIPVREVYPVTHRPALYRDPVTDIPYATARAFKIIREASKKYITAHGLPLHITAVNALVYIPLDLFINICVYCHILSITTFAN